MKQTIKDNQIVLEFNDQKTKDEFIEWFNTDKTLRTMNREMGKMGVQTVWVKPERSVTGDVRLIMVNFLVPADLENDNDR